MLHLWALYSGKKYLYMQLNARLAETQGVVKLSFFPKCMICDKVLN